MDSEIGAGRSQPRRVGAPRAIAFFGCLVSPRWVIAAVVALTVLKLLIVPAFYNLHMPVRDIGFGFGVAAQTVATTGLTKVCPPLFLDAPNLQAQSRNGCRCYRISTPEQ
jgi:hypothetical protein